VRDPLTDTHTVALANPLLSRVALEVFRIASASPAIVARAPLSDRTARLVRPFRRSNEAGKIKQAEAESSRLVAAQRVVFLRTHVERPSKTPIDEGPPQRPAAKRPPNKPI
jgi:hypothetical protein